MVEAGSDSNAGGKLVRWLVFEGGVGALPSCHRKTELWDGVGAARRKTTGDPDTPDNGRAEGLPGTSASSTMKMVEKNEVQENRSRTRGRWDFCVVLHFNVW